MTAGLLAGGLCMLIGALGAGWLAGRGNPPTPIVVLARDVARGTLLTAADFTRVNLNVDNPVDAVAWAGQDVLVGKRVLIDLRAGVIVSSKLVSDAAVLPAGMSVVGVVLPAGGYPSMAITSGDTVEVVATPATGEATVLAARAEVFRVEDPDDSPDRHRFVSLLVPSGTAPLVAAAAAKAELRLVAVG